MVKRGAPLFMADHQNKSGLHFLLADFRGSGQSFFMSSMAIPDQLPIYGKLD